MKVTYDDNHDLLDIELDGYIAGIETVGAPRLVRLERLLPVTYAAG